MSRYETTFICSPEVPAEKVEDLVSKVRKVVETAGGTIGLLQQLGRKRLAYPINKLREGNYVYLEMTGTGELTAALEKFFKVNDQVIRYLTVKVEKKKPVAVKPAIEVAAQAVEEVKPNESEQPAAPRAE
ncbi:MAG: 30S ribosomal protein S6 [Elusimicrobia bacterium]|nr:30S ribosomal protein S6 [Elusimicrobiota bacterium]